MSRGESLEVHPNINKSIIEIKLCRARCVPRLFKLTGAVNLDHAEGKPDAVKCGPAAGEGIPITSWV